MYISPSFSRPPFSSNTTRFIRTAALCCLIGGIIATLGAAVTALLPSAVPLTDASSPYTLVVYRYTQILWAISYALIVVGIVGVARTGAVGSSWLGKIGLWLAILGKGALTVGNASFAFFATATMTDAPIVFLDSLMGIASLVTALGLVLAGIVVLRVGQWQAWHRFIPLLCGLFVLVVLLPVLILELTVIQWPIAGWAACFVLLGIALYQQRAHPAPDMLLSPSGL
jgi:hypothetical protein